MTAPCHFEVHRSRRPGPARWRVYLIGANGETVFWTQRYTTEAAADEAIGLARSASAASVRRS